MESNNNFQWIDCSNPSNVKAPKNRHIIHEHSMKDNGKSRRKQPKRLARKRIPLDLTALEALGSVESKTRGSRNAHSPFMVAWKGGGHGSIYKYPVELYSTAEELIATGKFP